MIVYLDTSAVVPLLVEEPTTDFCQRIWNDADAVTTVRLTYVEATAALAQAQRHGRLGSDDLAVARDRLDDYWRELDLIEIDSELTRRAAQLAIDNGLRGYDAVHCASAEQVSDEESVAAAGDQTLLAAWRALGLATADTGSEVSADGDPPPS